jgi:hypothetical protein
LIPERVEKNRGWKQIESLPGMWRSSFR